MYYNEQKEKIIYVSNTQNGFIDISLAGATEPNPEYELQHPANSCYIFEYIVTGSGYIKSENRTYNVKGGDFCFIDTSSDAQLYSNPEDPYEKLWFNASGTLINTLVSLYAFEPITVKTINCLKNFIEIHDILSQTTQENQRECIDSLQERVFSLITSVQHDVIFPKSKKGDTLAEQIKNFIDNNVYYDITLEDLTKQFSLTKMHIIRIFKKEYDETPIQYLIMRRVEISKSLLLNTVMPIKEISSILKYSNTQHFSNTFKKYTGVSPNRYRQKKYEPVSVEDKVL